MICLTQQLPSKLPAGPAMGCRPLTTFNRLPPLACVRKRPLLGPLPAALARRRPVTAKMRLRIICIMIATRCERPMLHGMAVA